ncbi:hypothetical protein BsIDN1_17170 [Bacillus safensis]|uniref:Uncharacterized protein n=1 Tax=Bacillus safensis TaxID=561879 RepID=A0A5S9M829_BACIA|nr:hypothetical protein BsIDN1_17170 [Bacillus safensis]
MLALKQTFADLVLIHQTNALSEFELLVMDKGANALAQQTLRELYTEELKKTKENEWLQKWFQEEHSERDILEHLEETEGLKKTNRLCGHALSKASSIEEIAGNLYFLVSCRSIFQRAGFHLIPYEHQGQTLFILLNTRKKEDWKERAEKSAADIKQLYDRGAATRNCDQIWHRSIL